MSSSQNIGVQHGGEACFEIFFRPEVRCKRVLLILCKFRVYAFEDRLDALIDRGLPILVGG